MKTILLILFSLLYNTTFSQKSIVANAANNYIYKGLPAPIAVMVEGKNCTDIIVGVDNGEIKQNDACNYEVSADSLGFVNVFIMDKYSKNIIDKIPFRVKPIPDPIAEVAGITGGYVKKNILIAQLGITVNIYEPQICLVGRVQSYHLYIFRNMEILFFEKGESAYFSKNMIQEFSKLKEGDRIVILDIACKIADGTIRKLKPIELIIKE